MFVLNRWRSGTALLMAAGLASTVTLPAVVASSAMAETEPYEIAQLLNQTLYTLPVGTVVLVRYDEADRIIVKTDETADVTLTVAANVISQTGRVVIPAGSRIEGELRPVNGGTQFFSESVILDDSAQTQDLEQDLDATSEIITDTQIIDEDTDPDILQGAAIGAAAAAVLAEIFGGIDFLEVLGGAGLGALASILLRGSEEVEVVIVEPETGLDLTLQSQFVLEQ